MEVDVLSKSFFHPYQSFYKGPANMAFGAL